MRPRLDGESFNETGDWNHLRGLIRCRGREGKERKGR